MTRNRVIGGAVFAGLAVITILLFVESLSATTAAHIVGYQRTTDTRRIVIILALGRLEDIAERDVTETSDAVRITARVHRSSGSAPSDLQFFPITVTLRADLGTRAVLDETGAAIPDRGTYRAPLPSGPP